MKYRRLLRCAAQNRRAPQGARGLKCDAEVVKVIC